MALRLSAKGGVLGRESQGHWEPGVLPDCETLATSISGALGTF